MTDKWRWIVIIVALIVGAGLVVAGFVTGEQWTTLVGGLLSGSGGLAASQRLPAR